MITRYAEYDELPEIVRLTQKGFKEHNEKTEPERLIDLVYSSYARAPCVVLEHGGEIIGFWGLMSVVPKWNKEQELADYMLYIVPEFRSLKTVKLLTKAVTDTADRYGLKLRLNYIFNTDNYRAHIRLFERVGFKVRGVLGVHG